MPHEASRRRSTDSDSVDGALDQFFCLEVESIDSNVKVYEALGKFLDDQSAQLIEMIGVSSTGGCAVSSTVEDDEGKDDGDPIEALKECIWPLDAEDAALRGPRSAAPLDNFPLNIFGCAD